MNATSASGATDVLETLRKTRDGIELSPAEIDLLVQGYTYGLIPDAQMAAWLMAVMLQGLSPAGTIALTEAMLRSGPTLDFSDLGCKVVDKHSTGGVGDKTTLVVAPLVAAAGLVVPTISGRSLGHAGGTLDKVEAIAGFRVHLSERELRSVLEKCRCAIVAQTREIAPADRRIYALRHQTATVENPSLICASIMSKKLAEGLDALVLDVKTGCGAFIKDEAGAIALAELMVRVGRGTGTATVAVISNMDQPLGRAIGTALEVGEALSVLRGEGPEDVVELCVELAAHLLCAARHVPSLDNGRAIAAHLLASGKALETFREMVTAQGGDARVIDNPALLPQAPLQIVVRSPAPGYVASIDCERIGRESLALASLGGGAAHVDHSAGLLIHKKIGDPVSAGEPLCTIHASRADAVERASASLLQCYKFADAPPPRAPLIRCVVE